MAEDERVDRVGIVFERGGPGVERIVSGDCPQVVRVPADNLWPGLGVVYPLYRTMNIKHGK